ncbi:ASB_HP2_G0029490.mRNA.1.CDS.1 [Saccharomyces cerevisiae]|nr:Dls1p [Saccharomyces cerevisiae YJM1549]CAI5289641.1 ASB_HP2_G0029490.mRNA.1.CDS.1 [Saccharomyces cerevisiae]CAI6587816.1 ASB_HP1_G0029220.mRNA.1.CDS.1 [Saccharomyces cerevisiae]CAI6590750.1 ASB_HP2_G0029490.mRNA.1.CDS.1 [Saccharomyces cerevisiae]
MNNETSGKETASAPLCSPKLPVEKVQRIAKNDPEYMDTSDDAFVATAFATEFFVQVLTHESLHRQQQQQQQQVPPLPDELTLSYDDISAAIVHSSDGHLQFLNDVIPTTKNLRLLVEENRVRYTTSVMPPNEVYSAYVVNNTAPKPNIVEIDLDNDEDDDEDVTDQE